MVLCVLLGAAAHAAADSVRLRTSIAADRGSAVTLGMIAVLEGAEAERWADLVVLESAEPVRARDGWVTISMAQVRSALQGAGAAQALLGFSGDSCMVRLRGAVTPAPEVKPERVERPGPQIVDVSGAPTVRTRFASLLAEIYGVKPQDLRLSFNASDESLLSMSEHGRRIVVRPTTSGSSARASAEVRVLAGERTIASGTVSAGVELRRRVLVAGTTIDRDALVHGGMVREVSMWVTPGGGEATDLGEAVGRVARTRIREGDVLRLGDLESPVVVRRGDLLSVIALNGGVSVQVKARARSEGRVGDRIELRLDGSRRSFVAVVDGPGRAVIVLDSGTEVAEGE
ncbi:MAG: flagella basal body P-ring formation protein FlgA [Phycisphaeraceae bacterium]|nr:MAG: flagella basal body P-ring formation protein FlgA [Phycisphaeraceae bacterium]